MFVCVGGGLVIHKLVGKAIFCLGCKVALLSCVSFFLHACMYISSLHVYSYWFDIFSVIACRDEDHRMKTTWESMGIMLDRISSLTEGHEQKDAISVEDQGINSVCQYIALYNL